MNRQCEARRRGQRRRCVLPVCCFTFGVVDACGCGLLCRPHPKSCCAFSLPLPVQLVRLSLFFSSPSAPVQSMVFLPPFSHVTPHPFVVTRCAHTPMPWCCCACLFISLLCLARRLYILITPKEIQDSIKSSRGSLLSPPTQHIHARVRPPSLPCNLSVCVPNPNNVTTPKRFSLSLPPFSPRQRRQISPPPPPSPPPLSPPPPVFISPPQKPARRRTYYHPAYSSYPTHSPLHHLG